MLINKWWKIKQTHNFGFLISPTTNLFPHSGQSGNRGVSIMITLKKQKLEYEINNKIKYTTLQIRSMLVWKNKWGENDEKDTDANPPRGDGEWAWKSLFKNNFIKRGYNIREWI